MTVPQITLWAEVGLGWITLMLVVRCGARCIIVLYLVRVSEACVCWMDIMQHEKDIAGRPAMCREESLIT